jgi:hypothetical protein
MSSPPRRVRASSQQRLFPLQVQHSSDSEDLDRRGQSHVHRNEGSQTVKNIPIMKNEQEQTDDRYLMDQFSASSSPIVPRNFLHASLDQVKRLYDPSLPSSTSLRKSSPPLTVLFDKYPDRSGIIPLSNQSATSANPPAKDFRRRRTDLIPAKRSYPPVDDENIYRLF